MEEHKINMTDQRICLYGGEDLFKLHANRKEVIRFQNSLGEVIMHAWTTHSDFRLLMMEREGGRNVIVTDVSENSLTYIKQIMTSGDMFVTADGTLMTIVGSNNVNKSEFILAFGEMNNLKRKDFARIQDAVEGIEGFYPFRIFDGGGFELNKYQERMGAYW